jgi:hypothetical protein
MNMHTLKELIGEGPLTLSVNGDCMTGALNNGSMVSVEHKRWYWPGDVIILAKADDSLVSHRFLGYALGRSGWLALTRADKAEMADSPCHVSRILGRVESVGGTVFSCTFMQRFTAIFNYFDMLAHSLVSRLS